MVVQTFTPSAGFQLGYDEASVRYVEGLVLRLRSGADEEFIKNLSGKLGCYLGECIRRNFGGQWQAGPHGIGISFDAANAVYPLSKVEKLFRYGEGDSIVSFYTLIPQLFAKVLPPPA